MYFSLVVTASVFLLAACRPALETKLVGQWLSGCSIDICTITTLNADRTFFQRFDQSDLPDEVCSGTWRVDHDQLVLHVTLADKGLRDVLGKDVRFIISEFQHDRFIATSTEDKTKPLTWERR